MVVPRFVQQALTGQPLTVYGDGEQTRTFTHVKDAIMAILKLVDHPGAIGEIFNIGGKEEISIEKLAHLVNEVLKSPSSVIHIPYEKAYEEGFDDMRKRVPDIGKIENLIGYEPKCNLRDIVYDVAEYQKNHDLSSTRKVPL